MTTKKFTHALGNIRDGYLDEAISYTARRRTGPLQRWVAVAAAFCLIVTGALLLPLLQREPGGVIDPPNAGEYPYNDEEVLDYVGMPLDAAETEGGRVVFNEITDIAAYRRFNTRYDDRNLPYYSTRTTAFDLLAGYPISGEGDFIYASVFEKDGRVENCPDYGKLLSFYERAPMGAELLMRILGKEEGAWADAYYNGRVDCFGFLFYPDRNCTATVVIGRDIAAIDERFESILPILKSTLGTQKSSYVGEQEISVHYFYQNRLFRNSKTEEAYQYYVYFERDGLQYLYQFSSNWSLVGKNISALHNPPHTLHYVATQKECRELFIDYLLTLVSPVE